MWGLSVTPPTTLILVESYDNGPMQSYVPINFSLRLC